MYLDHLEVIRNLLVAGWMLLALGWAIQLGQDARDDRERREGKRFGPPPVYCPLHRGLRSECEAKHHAE